MSDTTQGAPVLQATGVAKRFGAVVALSDASLTVRHGEIVALMGANGAGKSTFVKILTGALDRNGGTIRLHGQDFTLNTPAAARAAGVVPVYQEPALIPDLTVADNLKLTRTPRDAFLYWVEALGINGLDVEETARHLPLATLRILDLARAIASGPEVLMLDEMTAALPTDLVEKVITVVRGQADEGRAVIYISHRFQEIAQLCDRATVLRDGATVGDLKIEPGVEDRAVELMLGAALGAGEKAGDRRSPARAADAVPRLEARSVAARPKLEDVSFALYRGEVLGVVALEGQGQDELFEICAGFRRPDAGALAVDGKPVGFGHPADAIRMGLTYVPGDRAHALLAGRSVRENIALPLVSPVGKWGPIPLAREKERVDAAIERLAIDTRAQGEVRRLSGGNQQKVTIGRWIAKGVETLLLFDPTRGIDVRTKRQIYALVRELAQQGAAILYYTSELDEVRLACDRVVIIFKGRVVEVIDAAEASDERLMRGAYGLTGAQGASA